jgi:hypothetical protein
MAATAWSAMAIMPAAEQAQVHAAHADRVPISEFESMPGPQKH